jgi:hypothetical protein
MQDPFGKSSLNLDIASFDKLHTTGSIQALISSWIDPGFLFPFQKLILLWCQDQPLRSQSRFRVKSATTSLLPSDHLINIIAGSLGGDRKSTNAHDPAKERLL